ncbi:MAG TPA: ABC transporter permease, partial [Armatimonadota bacterium]|nr:ABC transporter permease [Armatimonadota bacterium]
TTARDVVKGVMFYLALLLPFAFFLERLLVGSTDLKSQLLWLFGIFVVAFIVMSWIHPAFAITMSPMIVLLAFIMLALSVFVIVLIAGKFEQQLKEFNKQVSGTHTADIGRMSIAAAAFSLGISNMRRRKARSFLTCTTLVLLTFIVLSFTSVVTGIRYNVVPAPGEPRYNGVMLRSPMWEPLEESSFRLLNDEFGRQRIGAQTAPTASTSTGGGGAAVPGPEGSGPTRAGAVAAPASSSALKITQPNGGEELRLGQPFTLAWTPGRAGGKVNIELSRDGGLTWKSLFRETANDGSELWTVSGSGSERALLRVSAVGGAAAQDTSDAEFRVVSPQLVAARAWFFGTQMGEQTFLSMTRGDKKFDARAVLGLSPLEPQITGVDSALYAGRWFRPSDFYTTILAKESADALGVTEEAVNAGTARVRFSGIDYSVVGLVDNDNFKAIKDLDQEPLTPVDFIMMQRQSSSGGRGGSGGDSGFKEYTHLEPNTVIIVPYQTLINQGGEVRSVAINLATPDQVTQTRLELMPRLGLNLYAGEGGQTYRYSSIGGSSIAGAGTLVVPILIAALIVLNTMLGAVFERQKEIHIFSSIGLAPNHVAMLFMAESLVYAVLGAMAGYMLGQGSAKLIVWLNIFPGLNLNFSSLSAVFSTFLVMGVVMLSTLYPAKKAGEVATPAIERTWRTPDPVGDQWTIPLPFMVTGDQAVGLNTFLGEWFRSFEEHSIGDFVTQHVQTSEEDTPEGRAYQIQLTAWLAPFDLGVSEQVRLRTTPTDMEDVFALTLIIDRLSGDISNWKRVNRRFLNTLRKQFLIWRTLKTDERERYLGIGGEPALAAE